MEKYFIVTKSELGKDYMLFKNNMSKLNKIAADFFKKQGISTTEYVVYPGSKLLGIKPTKQDLILFDSKLAKGDVYRIFKKNSKIQKLWLEEIKNFDIISKPNPIFYINESSFYGSRTRLFQANDEVYCSIEMNRDFSGGEGFEEIKASQFFKIIEEYNEKISQS